jgi:anti-sigma factor RsiW
MTCSEVGSFIPAYCDGELAGVDREQVERHLVSCAGCAAKSRLQARFKAAVRAHLPRPPVPSTLRMRIRESLIAEEAAPRSWSWNWLGYPRLVPAATAVVLLVAITGTVRQSQSMVLAQAQRSYRSEMPMDVVSPDCGSIASWFRGRVDFPVHAPLLGKQGTCQGGRLVNVGERPAAYIVYRVADGHRLAFLVFDPSDAIIAAPQHRVLNGREVYFGTAPGVSTAAYRDRGIGYVATSDLDEDALTRLVMVSLSH